MVGGTPKPFACTNEGCSMTFTTEDHLNVHQRKHDMILNLGLGGKANIFIADQTPTPTRFLRNCEEVGLFQDLQNVNPFEETFRRAVELVKTGSLPEPDLPGDDSLHTPHVFPHLPEENVSGIYNSQSCVHVGPSKSSDKSELQDTGLKAETSQSTSAKTVHDSEIKGASYSVSEKTLLLDINNITNSPDHDYVRSQQRNSNECQAQQESVNLKLTDETVDSSKTKVKQQKVPAKLKLQQVLLKNKKLIKNIANTNKNVLQAIRLTPVTLQNLCSNASGILSSNVATVSLNSIPVLPTNKFSLTSLPSNSVAQQNNSNRSVINITSNSTCNDSASVNKSGDSKRRDILERNRAAAIRCREKRKKWIDNLQSKFDGVCKSNLKLQNEVNNLRNEVSHLKTLLLAHKDCPVTKAMTMGENTTLEVGPNPVLQINVPASNKLLETNQANKDKYPKTNKIRSIRPKISTLPHIIIEDMSLTPNTDKNGVIVIDDSFSYIIPD